MLTLICLEVPSSTPLERAVSESCLPSEYHYLHLFYHFGLFCDVVSDELGWEYKTHWEDKKHLHSFNRKT